MSKYLYTILKTGLDRILCQTIKYVYLNDKANILKINNSRFKSFKQKIETCENIKVRDSILNHYCFKYLQKLFDELEREINENTTTNI